MLRNELIDRLADSWSARHRPESMNTDWGQTLLAYGLLSAVRTTGNAQAREYLRRWLIYHLGAGLHLTYFVGSWGIGLLYPEIVELFPEHRHALDNLAERLYELILYKAIRNGDGVILHNVDLPHVYVDTVYYSAPVLAKLGQALGRDEWREDAVRQLERHLDILRDPESGFSIHCEQNLSGLRSEGAWGRGNGWVAMACAELLLHLDSDSKAYRRVGDILHSLSTSLLPYQTGSGLWRTIITDPSSYEETSATGMFLFGMIRGRRLGLLGSEFDEPIERGLEGMEEYVNGGGILLGCSEGTWPGTVDYYKGLDRGEWWWGTGAYLLALGENRQWERRRDEGGEHQHNAIIINI